MGQEEWAHYASAAFNPPSEECFNDTFRNEYYGVESRLETILQEFGENDAYGEGDYYLDNGYGRTRGLGFEVSHESSLENPQVVPAIQRLLASLPDEYEVCIQGENFDFYVYVSPREVKAFTEDLERLARFGLKPKEGSVSPAPSSERSD